jgi:DedD protein
VFKVRIGPLLDKVKAQAVKNKLTQLNVNSFVSPDE